MTRNESKNVPVLAFTFKAEDRELGITGNLLTMERVQSTRKSHLYTYRIIRRSKKVTMIDEKCTQLLLNNTHVIIRTYGHNNYHIW
jgi:hypothetical protein